MLVSEVGEEMQGLPVWEQCTAEKAYYITSQPSPRFNSHLRRLAKPGKISPGDEV